MYHITIRHILIVTFKGFHLNFQFGLGVRMCRPISRTSHSVIARGVLY